MNVTSGQRPGSVVHRGRPSTQRFYHVLDCNGRSVAHYFETSAPITCKACLKKESTTA